MNVLITGRAGTGKTTVADALLSRGYQAFDGDLVPGLLGWQDSKTGEKVELDATKYVDIDKYSWIVDEVKLKQFLVEQPESFLCVGAHNELDLARYFDHCLVLDIPPDIHAKRLSTRTNNSYGRDPRMIEAIIAWQARLVEEAKQRGFTIIDASAPIERVVDEVLKVAGV